MKRSSSLLIQFVFLLLFLSLLTTLLNMMGIPNPFYNPFSHPKATPKLVTPAPGKLGADEQATIEVFKRLSPSVVFIINTQYKRDFLTFRAFEVPQGSGSGFVWDHDGHIVTNFHVIYQASSISVTLFDQTVWEASVIGADPDHDLAVLKIGAPKDRLQPVPIGSSKELQVGQKALAIGNPFGLDTTLTVGVISALGRQIESMTGRPIFDVIQTDAAINPGNSGGPLIDSFGRVIGVNTQIVSPSGSNSGIGFAVPVDTVNRIIPQLISHGLTQKAYLGVYLANEARLKWLQQLGYENLEGAIVQNVSPGSPAERAGILDMRRTGRGDILFDTIIELNNQPVKNNDDLIRLLEEYQPGDEVHLRIRRMDQILEMQFLLAARPEP